MSHLEINGIEYTLPDGRPLLDAVSFRVGTGERMALVGPNGAGKSTLLRIVIDELTPHGGAIITGGPMGIMRQFVGHYGHSQPDVTVRELLADAASPAIQAVTRELVAAENAMLTKESEAVQMRYATALAEYGEAGGYEMETFWDKVCDSALGVPFTKAADRGASTLSGGEQKRLVLTALLDGPAPVLVLDEPDNYLDVPAKRWLEKRLAESGKTVLLISHDRELLANVATKVATLEPGAAGSSVWIHPAGFDTWHTAREARFERLEELRRRWDEDHAKLKALVAMYKQKAKFNDSMASRYQAAQTRLAKFEADGPPEARPPEQNVRMRLHGGRTAKRAVMCADVELTGLMKPFDTELWYGDRVGVLGSNGSGKSHFLRLLAAGGSDPDVEHQPVGDMPITPVAHTGSVRLGSRVRPGWFAQTHHRPDLEERTLLEILNRGDEHRGGLHQEAAAKVLDRYGLARQGEQTFGTLSGGQQARFQILLLELSGATLLLLDEPTDNLDMESAEALEEGLAGFDGTVVAVTHDRWFTRGFDRFLVFRSSGEVEESTEPVFDESRVIRNR